MIYQLGDRRVRLRGEGHFIAENASVIGSVDLGARTSIWFNAVLRGDMEPIVLGEETNIQDGAVLHTDPGFPIEIGQAVTVGHLAMLHGCTIGRGCLIGIKSIIMNGARIGEGCIIGANSLIAEGKHIPPRSLVLGSPGRVVREVTAEETALLRDYVEEYLERIDRYRATLRPDTGVTDSVCGRDSD